MTSRRSLRTLGARIAKVVFSFSLLLTCVSWGAGDYRDLHRALQRADNAEAARILSEQQQKGAFEGDDQLSNAVRRALRQPNDSSAMLEARRLVEVRALIESDPAPSKEATRTARRIKNNPLYRDPGVQHQANWLAEATRRLQNVDLDASCAPRCDAPASDVETPDITWLKYVIWGLLGAGLGTFLYFAFRHFSWTRTMARRSRALLDEDEPERTLDEYLTLADKLAAERRYREAVRCLYLACLLRLDEERIIRFARGQTNWEHLARFESSPKRPPGLDLRPATKAFDLIWYGMRPAGLEDVESFRGWYRQVVDLSKAVAA